MLYYVRYVCCTAIAHVEHPHPILSIHNTMYIVTARKNAGDGSGVEMSSKQKSLSRDSPPSSYK